MVALKYVHKSFGSPPFKEPNLCFISCFFQFVSLLFCLEQIPLSSHIFWFSVVVSMN